MRLVTFADSRGERLGVLDDGMIRDVTSAEPTLPVTMVELIAGGDTALARVAETVESAPSIPVDKARLLAPIPHPPHNVVAVGRNYRDHAQEFTDSGFDASEKAVVPDHPVIFTKAASSIVGPGAAIDTANDPTGTTDYEGELGVVIGRPTKGVSEADAYDHVFGYTIINDVTARDLQARHIQWFVGKSPDTFCPMGPCVVTREAMPDLSGVRLRTRVNGELRQEFPVSEMVFDIPTLIATISSVMTLAPGDVIATGTGVGVGIGLDPPRFLTAGDQVEIEIDGIGTLESPVV